MPDLNALARALAKLWPDGNAKVLGLKEGIVAAAPSVFAKYGIDSALLVAHVMAQISHECGCGLEVEENLNYTAARISEVWPSRFPSAASAMPYAHNPRALANKVYGGRMGNVGLNDGWTYRGRGATQTTGRDGYSALGQKVGLDLLNHPDKVNDPTWFLECGVADFILCGCLPYAQRDDVTGVTKRLNGGLIGLTERKVWLARWKSALASAPVAVPPVDLPPVIKPESKPFNPAKPWWLALIDFILSIFKR